jgi:hypothetical protein
VHAGASHSVSRSPMSLNDVSITELEPRWSTSQSDDELVALLLQRKQSLVLGRSGSSQNFGLVAK